MLLHTWLPATLRGAGLKVVETSGWTSRSHGGLPDKIKVVWHHDASGPGDSPGALNWMISNWGSASAQVWVDNYGTWYLVGVGQAYHAGTVKSGMPGNTNSIGIETDQTTNEPWPAAQLDSLRRGTAAIFKKQAVGSDWLHMHKTICDPVGRKVDPYALDLGAERNTVAKLISGGSTATPAPKPPTQPRNLLEWIMTLPGAPAGLTYQQFLTAVAKEVWDTRMPTHSSIVDGKEAANSTSIAKNTLAGIATNTTRTQLKK